MMACEICKKPFITSTEDSPFVCNICEKSFSVELKLKRHMLSHEVNIPQVCHTCKDSTYNLRLSKKGSFACETCGKCFTTKRSLLRHASEHTLENVLTCDECGKSFKNVTALKKHAVTHKPKKSGRGPRNKVAVTTYECRECDVSFNQLQQYETHCCSHEKYKCGSCEVYFASDQLLKQHQESCKPDPGFQNTYPSEISSTNVVGLNSSNSNNKKHTCNICNKSFTRKSALEGHLFSHYDENRESGVEDDSDADADYQCNFKEVKLYEQAKRVCLPKLKIRRSYPCEKCDYVCASKTFFNKHMASHKESPTNKEIVFKKEKVDQNNPSDKLMSKETNPEQQEKRNIAERKIYRCRVCQETFESKDIYKKHKLTHNNEKVDKEEKSYTCQICLKVFSKKKHLKKHVKVHLNGEETTEMSSLSSEEFLGKKKSRRNKKFACGICGKLFAGETCLRKHESKHKGDKEEFLSKGRKGKKPKTLICDFCNEDFTGRRHVYVKHKLSHTPEVCGICDARFVDRASLREHCKVHIGTEEGRRFLECSQKAHDAKNGVVQPEPKVEYIYLVLR